MSDAAQLAKTAREHLAAALNALQSNAHVPDALMDLAEPIAEAMSVLHRIERTQGANLEGREMALQNVRTALNQLQALTVHHPAIDVVMENVASSLSKVHALTRIGAAGPQAAARPASVPPAAIPPAAPVFPPPGGPPRPAPMAQQAPPQQAPPQMALRGGTVPMSPQQQQPPQVPAAQPLPGGGLGYTQAMPQASPFAANQPSRNVPQPAQFPPPAAQFGQPAGFAPQAAPMPQPAAMIQPAPMMQPGGRAMGHQMPMGQPMQQQPMHQQPMQQQPMQQQPMQQQPMQQQPMQQQPMQQPMQQPVQPQPSAPGVKSSSGAPKMDVELGAHSPSNFYKGLGGNDVIEHGGIFVATYKIPKLGSPVMLRVLLPGDYEFQASAVVQWTREGAAGESAEPGFGARFTQISPEARQLVYRYTRNREPIFYDDL